MRSDSQRQLRAMLRKNWLLKIRHPFTTCAEMLLPTVVMLMLIAVRTQVDTQIHHVEPHIQKGTYVEVGKSDISPSFDSILMFLYMKGEHLAFVPDSSEIRSMLEFLSLNHPLLKMVGKMYKSELELESYIRSDLYGISDAARNLSNPKVRGAVVFHSQGPQIFDYSIRLNHTWAFSGFPDVKSIMDVNGPYLNDLELGFNVIPTLQYGYSGFLSLQKIVDSYIIHVSHNKRKNDFDLEHEEYPSVHSVGYQVPTNNSSMQLLPENIRITPFPTREYTDDEFQSIVKSVMGVLYLLGFLYTISRLISYPVFEKESKIKEGLLMMGLKNKIFYLSWFITYSIQFAVSSAIITACTMSTLFLYSDKTLVFTYFFIFGLSTVMLSFLISTFFSRAKTAVAVGTLSFLGAFFPYYSVNEPAIPMIWKILASLLSPTAFALGTINFADYERAHVGVRWTNIWQASSGVNFLVCLVMMMFDTFLYCAIGLYFDKVLSRGTGLCYPSNFLSMKFFFGRKCLTEEDNYTEITQSSEKTTFKPAFEAISFDMKQQELEGRCIQIRNLCKVFMSEKGKCTAVNSLDLTLYENQILALLGHNGAGKSTTISMLSGLLSPTSGDALVFGKNILTDMDDIRKILGVCPQNDILFPELTVKEHMEIYAVLKGVEEDSFSKKVTEMIEEVGLADKTNTIVGALSGGMKRKLSIGIALVGNSKVIILDEPTSGMDPYSMRSTWQLIRKMKKGRIILLTTHSMDEADILGDRIAIMGNGQLQCCGSSLFLKHRYGVGYTLTLAKTSPNNTVASDIVYRHVPMATCISDVGTEMSFKLPISSSSSFESMFREIESCIKRSKVHDEAHGIASYGISVTTLEEVFLKVAGQDIVDFDIINQPNTTQAKSKVVSEVSNATLMKPSTSKLSCRIYVKFIGTICSTVGKTIFFMFYKIYSCFAFVLAKLCSCGMITNSTFWRHSNALLIKRAISARRDRRTIVFQLLIPAVFLLFGLLFLRLKPHPDQYSMTLTTSYFNPLLTGGGGGPIPFNLSTRISQEVASCVKGGWIQKEEARAFKFPSPEKALANAIDAAGPTLGPILLSMSEYLITSLNESYQSRYGAVVMDDQNNDGSLGYTVFHNSSCQHAAPTYINVMNAAILRHATGDKNMTIQIRNHPLPMTMSQKSQRHDLDAFSAAIVVSIAFSFIPASFAVSIVKEREVKAKHQQLISGVSILSYWMSTYLWDFISFLFPTVLAVILFYIFGLSQFIGNGCLVTTIIIFINYGLAIASSTYCLTFFFSDHTVAQNVILLLHFLSGLILMVLSFIMGLIEATKSANRVLKHIFRLSPSFCFADGLASLALRHQGIKLGSGSEILDWDVAGASITYLFIESIVYFLLTIGLEFLPHPKLWISGVRHWWGHLFSSWDDISQNYYQPLPGSFDLDQLDDEDIDVKEERRKIVNGYADNAIIYLHNLRKVFPGNHNNSAKVAVHSLTFAVQEGECFGFLGTNGAGKTTTLSMLTGEEYPSDGSAYIFGNNIRSDPKAARRHIGYCPQFDALLEFLTVREHLQLYARIKAVPEINLDDVVNEKLTEFDLWRHADKPSVVLSGGNKRKLSVAIAMIGNPPIVILDEPSTGMDPVAKRFMWDVISRLSTREGNTAVILTTHSMAEAQALCTRIGIMVSGKLRCIGSAQHLKSRFGNHLELEMKPTEINSVEVDNLCRKIQDTLFDVPCNTRGVFGDLEICIGGNESISTNSISEISLTKDMVVSAAHMLGNKVSVSALVSSSYITDGAFGEQLSEQLVRDGCIPLRIFSEWWLTKEKISCIDSFIQTSFHGATFHGCDGLNIKYQLPYGEGSSLADIFGHIEHNREELGIEEYSISQSTLETIFNHFAEMG